jgi:hypothetical protein
MTNTDDRPDLSSGGTLHQQNNKCQIYILPWDPDGPRHQDGLIIGRKVTLTQYGDLKAFRAVWQ